MNSTYPLNETLAGGRIRFQVDDVSDIVKNGQDPFLFPRLPPNQNDPGLLYFLTKPDATSALIHVTKGFWQARQ